jgi:hypothetical protein
MRIAGQRLGWVFGGGEEGAKKGGSIIAFYSLFNLEMGYADLATKEVAGWTFKKS